MPVRMNAAIALLVVVVVSAAATAAAVRQEPTDLCGTLSADCFEDDPDFLSPIEGIGCDDDPFSLCRPGSLALSHCQAACESCVPLKDCRVQDGYAGYMTAVTNPVTNNVNVFIKTTRAIKAIQLRVRCPSEDVEIMDAHDYAPGISSMSNVFVFIEDNKVFFLTMREDGLPHGSLRLLVSLSMNQTCSQELEIFDSLITDVEGNTVPTCGTAEEPCSGAKLDLAAETDYDALQSSIPLAEENSASKKRKVAKQSDLDCWIAMHFDQSGANRDCESRVPTNPVEVKKAYNLVSLPNVAFNALFDTAYRLGVSFDNKQGLLPSMGPSGSWVTAIGLQVGHTEVYIGAKQIQEYMDDCLVKPTDCLTYGSVSVNGEDLVFIGKHSITQNISIELINQEFSSSVIFSSPLFYLTVDIIPAPKGWSGAAMEYQHLDVTLLKAMINKDIDGLLGVGWHKPDSSKSEFHRLDSWNSDFSRKPRKASEPLDQILKRYRRKTLFSKPGSAPPPSHSASRRGFDYEDITL